LQEFLAIASDVIEVDLEGEGNDGFIDGLDYNSASVQIGLKYNF
jgi:hypothetical protein